MHKSLMPSVMFHLQHTEPNLRVQMLDAWCIAVWAAAYDLYTPIAMEEYIQKEEHSNCATGAHSFRAHTHPSSKQSSAITLKQVARTLYSVKKTFLLICFSKECWPQLQDMGLMDVYTDHAYSVFTFQVLASHTIKHRNWASPKS